MLWILVFLTLALFLLYIKIKYFTLHGPLPGLSPHFFFGNLIQSDLLGGKTTFAQVLLSFQKRFGDIYQFWLGATRIVVVSGADDVKHIFSHRKIYDHGGLFIESMVVFNENALFVLNGAKYKRHSALTVPLLRRAKIISHLDIIIDCTDKLLAKWRDYPVQHIHTNITDNCENLILDIFGFIAFDFDLKILDPNNETDSNEFTNALHDFLSTFKITTYLPKIVAAAYLRWSPRHQRALKTVETFLYPVMDQELTTNEDSVVERKKISLIASLVSSLQKDEKAEALKSEEEKEGLSRKEVLDQMLGFLIAAYESTSNTLAWFVHFMSKHPRVQQKIKAELMANNISEHLTLERVDSLIYLDCVINEVLRLYAPFPGTTRVMTMDDRLPQSGAQLSKGTQVFIPINNLAQDSRLWSVDPNRFYPERFLNEDKDRHSHAFILFGGGHRQCVGQDLVRFELKVIAARFMQHVTFGDGGPQINSGGVVTSMSDRPRNIGVTMEFH